jgi:hypothetical protein
MCLQGKEEDSSSGIGSDRARGRRSANPNNRQGSAAGCSAKRRNQLRPALVPVACRTRGVFL